MLPHVRKSACAMCSPALALAMAVLVLAAACSRTAADDSNQGELFLSSYLK